MPNWCTNRLTVSGTAVGVKTFADFVASDESAFSFRKIIPCPDSLWEVESGSSEIHYDVKYGDWEKVAKFNYSCRSENVPKSSKEDFVLWWRENPGNGDFDRLADKYKRNFDTTGHTTWYSFCTSTWGTKWDARSVHLDVNPPTVLELLSESQSEKEGTSIVIYTFDTAWSAPHPVLEKLASLFPTIGMRHEYIEESMAFGGVAVYEEGELASSTEAEGNEIYGLSSWLDGHRPEPDLDSEEVENEQT